MTQTLAAGNTVIYQSPATTIEYFVRDGHELVRKNVTSLFGEFWCGREVKVLERLVGLPGVQQLAERDSPTSFVSEYIPGTTLLEATDLPNDYFDKLAAILESVHARGVADIDFAHSRDLMVDKNGEPVVIDLACSVIYDSHAPMAPLIKPVFDYVRELNHRYLLSRRARFAPHTLTEEERLRADDVGMLANTWRVIQGNNK